MDQAAAEFNGEETDVERTVVRSLLKAPACVWFAPQLGEGDIYLVRGHLLQHQHPHHHQYQHLPGDEMWFSYSQCNICILSMKTTTRIPKAYVTCRVTCIKWKKVILASLYIYKENHATKNNSFSILDIEPFISGRTFCRRKVQMMFRNSLFPAARS